MKSIYAFFVMLMLSCPAFSAEEIDLKSVCKEACPKASTNEEAHKCAEKKGRLNKSFKKSTCYIENEKYEKTRPADQD